jgi:hypothetical protein
MPAPRGHAGVPGASDAHYDAPRPTPPARSPTLLVGLFAPPEDISAAVCLETLYYYALAHQNNFDVRRERRRGAPGCPAA